MRKFGMDANAAVDMEVLLQLLHGSNHEAFLVGLIDCEGDASVAVSLGLQ